MPRSSPKDRKSQLLLRSDYDRSFAGDDSRLDPLARRQYKLLGALPPHSRRQMARKLTPRQATRDGLSELCPPSATKSAPAFVRYTPA